MWQGAVLARDREILTRPGPLGGAGGAEIFDSMALVLQTR